MTKIIVGDLHEKIVAAGVPIDGVALLKDDVDHAQIRVDYRADATPEQVAQAEAIIKAYDQDAINAAKNQPAKVTTAEKSAYRKPTKD